MIIKSADFVISNQEVSKCPKTDLPEYAFIGRSNVGKSSLINMLTNRKKLAKTSSTPGKTQLINHYLINEEWYLVDLPGYGFAKISKSAREKWGELIHQYLMKRKNLRCTFILIDARIEPQKIDLEFMEWLGINQLPFVIVFTKSDKLNKTELINNIERYKSTLLEKWTELPQFIVSSSITSQGRDAIYDLITDTNNLDNLNK
ncbi:MAG: YihA family ribosome biogenesis GTP-binding protein [Bacteroidetes bacterium HGW-Bacteroidetes-17]|jgi:GTP-binding protein|nr:MAG: YihA family ribosome biogenesis GTP-binding protein [Bacteroidetes bacterium HGW-Bacteroidetes-17]